MKKIILAAALLATSSPAFAWTYDTDDGRKVTTVQAGRDGAACDVAVYAPGLGVHIDMWMSCMRSKGYIVHACTPYLWLNGRCT